MAGRRREQGTISGAKLRPRDLAAQNLELVAQDQQLDVLYVQATTTPNERPKQGPDRDVEEGEDHVADRPSPLAEGARHEYWHPSGVRGVGSSDDGSLLPSPLKEQRVVATVVTGANDAGMESRSVARALRRAVRI